MIGQSSVSRAKTVARAPNITNFKLLAPEEPWLLELHRPSPDSIPLIFSLILLSDKFRLFASIAFMTVVIVIGVPMWWKTTEVYRVSLPSSSILRLSDEPIQVSVKVGIFTFKEERAKLLIKELENLYKENEHWILIFEQITVSDKFASARTPASLEAMLLKQYDLNAGDFAFIEWPKLQEDILMTTERTALMRGDTSASKLKQVINVAILQAHRVHQILSQDQRYTFKTEAPQAEYDVVISVLNPRPESMDVIFNVAMAADLYIAPFLKEVSDVSNYTLKTQWKYQLPFEADLRQVRDGSKVGRHYALPESSLPHIITSIEKNLGVGITAKPAINLVVYVPPCEIAPVHIYNSANERATLHNIDAFISPKWGGVIIANPSIDACLQEVHPQQKVQVYVKHNDVMQIMMHQLYKLLDISADFHIEGVKTVAVEQIAPRRWQYEAYIRRSTITHILTSTNTLQSLIKLLDNISYIVINDNVGAAINEAYEHIVMAKEALAANQLMEASRYAKIAFVSSEQAFFDASLLAQLYFPDEQKYAIYIPLFLPIMVPVITSFTMTRKLLAKLRSNTKVKVN